MADFLSLSRDALLDRLKAAESPVILMHIRPDADTYGSAVALQSIFALLGKHAELYCADEIPERIAFIGDFAETLPVKAEGRRTVIAVDVASPAQLDAAIERYPEIDLMIDHHRSGTRFADHYVVPDISATGEILLDLAETLLARGDIKEFPAHLASALYAAIASDTGSFKYESVTPDTFRAAARLVEYGARHAEISHLLFDSKPAPQMRAEALTQKKTVVLDGGRIALAVVTRRDRAESDLKDADFETAVDVVRALRGVRIAAVLKESEKEAGLYKASLRATDADVASVAALFGGGGHIRAAGCSLRAETPEKAVEMLLSAIRENT